MLLILLNRLAMRIHNFDVGVAGDCNVVIHPLRQSPIIFMLVCDKADLDLNIVRDQIFSPEPHL